MTEPEPPSPGHPAVRFLRPAAIFLLALAIAWIAGHVAWFWRLHAPLWNADLDGPDGAAGPRGVFSALFLPWSFSWENSPPAELGRALVVLVLTQVLGLLLLRRAQVYLRPAARQAMALVLGVGASGIVFELLTMAHLLRTPVVWGAWAVMLAGAWWVAGRRGDKPVARWWGGGPVGYSIDMIDREEWPEHLMRRTFQRDDLPAPAPVARVLVVLAWLAVGFMTALTYWHAVLLPEGYWDSLILYLGYARMIFLEHSFPFKAEAQVGIGLGANYPHLYPLYGAAASTAWGEWSDLHQRLLAPTAGLAATLLVGEAARMGLRSPVAGAVAALLFRVTPNVIAYTTYASDYALSLALAGALLLAVVYFARTRSKGALAVLFAIPAIGMHLNYLMIAFWGPAVLGMMAGLSGRQVGLKDVPDSIYPVPDSGPSEPPPGPPLSPDAPGPFAILANGHAWRTLVMAMVLGGTWLARNAVLTGNPVYAFFPEVFTKSVRVNVDVLRSAELEWFRNGDGIGRLAESHRDGMLGITRDEADPAYRRTATLGDRLAASWLFWTGFESVRVDAAGRPVSRGDWRGRLAVLMGGLGAGGDLGYQRHVHSYKMAPTFPGFLPVGLVLGVAFLALGLRPRSTQAPETRALLMASLVLCVGLLAYMYLLADFYLYQIIPVVAPAAVLGALVVWLMEAQPRLVRVTLGTVLGLALGATALVPGIAMSLMNFKINTSREVALQRFDQASLSALRNPGMPPRLFLEVLYGPDVDMWEYINEHLRGERLLTHENRHYVLDPSIRLVHLDDWAIQRGYGRATPGDTLAFLADQGLRYYLFVPNERNHPINAQLGMDRVVQAGLAREIHRAGENVLYALGPESDLSPDDERGFQLEMDKSPPAKSP